MSQQEGTRDRGRAAGLLAHAVAIGLMCVPFVLGALCKDNVSVLWRVVDLLSLFRVVFVSTVLAFVGVALGSASRSKRSPGSTLRGWGLIALISLYVWMAESALAVDRALGLYFLIVPACLVWSALRREARVANPAQSWTLLALALLAVRATFPSLLPNGWPLCAYDEGLGTWVWICIHALACLTVGRLWAHRRRLLSILLAGTWTLALFFFLHNDQTGGHDLLARWR